MALLRFPESPLDSNGDDRLKTSKLDLVDQRLGVIRLLLHNEHRLDLLCDRNGFTVQNIGSTLAVLLWGFPDRVEGANLVSNTDQFLPRGAGYLVQAALYSLGSAQQLVAVTV